MVGVIEVAVLSAFLQVLFDRTARKEVIDFFLNRPDGALLERLKENLLSLKVVLSDAEEKQFTDPHVREWVDMLKDAVYDADDVFESIATKTSKVRDYASSLNPFAERVKPKLNLINEKLKSLVNQKDLLGLKEGGVGKLFPLSFPTTSLVDINEVYGRDGDRDKIKEFLLSGNANGRGVPVVAIVGMAGVGKTTLAQLLFNDDEVRERFSTRSWAYVSGGLDVYETTKRICVSVRKSENCNITDLNLLQLELQDRLARKRFLLILDDFWNENFLDWDILKRPFESGDCGSRIIVTTRNQSVALALHADLTLSLSHLSEEHSWKLFSGHAFKSRNPDKHPALREIGDKIAKRCKGLPLAAKTLGSLLRSKEDPEEWSSILNSEIWELSNDKSDILPALRLSYSHLPSHLKRCFAYCSIFPKGCKIEKWKLICLWMAEGILPQPRKNKRVEDVGAECFQELLSRSFFQLGPQGSYFLMHDLVNDLAQYVAGEFFSKLEDIKSSKTTVKPRHVSYFQSRDDGPKKFEALNVYRESLRTFLPFRSEYSNPSITDNFVQELKSYIHLRVLSLSHYGITTEPDSIKKLKHLRYLDLSSTKIRQLSDSVVKLHNLETLLLSNCRDLTKLPKGMFKLINLRLLDISGCSRLEEMPEVPDSIKELKHLRYLNLSSTKISQLFDSVIKLHNLETLLLSNCRDLTKLPKGMFKLINLRFLDISGCSRLEEMPAQFGELPALQVLRHFVASQKSGAGMSELGKLSQLHSLSMVKVENVVAAQDAALASFGNKECLRELELEWTCTLDSQREATVLDKLQPHNNLMRLKIRKFGGNKLPDWMGSSLFSSLVFLSLDGCQSCSSLPSFGQLPSLRELHILKMQSLLRVGPEFCGNGRVPFGSLEILKFEDMPNWVEWSPNGNGQGQEVQLTSLRVLHINNCPSLTGDLNQLPADKLAILRSPVLEDLLLQRNSHTLQN